MAAPNSEAASIALQDSIHLTTQPATSRAGTRNVLIYFIPGNPGLISYYATCLAHLRSLLQPLTDETGTTFSLVGNSLAGFHLHGTQTTGSDGQTPLPLNLEQQVGDVETRISLESKAIGEKQRRSGHGSGDVEVILIGHSVGAYITMCLLSRQAQRTRISSPTSFKITAAIGLFPTVIDLAASPRGQQARCIAHVPFISHFLQLLARILSLLISMNTLVRIVQLATGHPSAASNVTASFLASETGVRQSIYLAQHELLEMREDRWGDEVWGTTFPSPRPLSSTTARNEGSGEKSPARLFFFWGAEDHWIASITRDAVIARRAGTAERAGPKMEVDTTYNLPHDFCVRERDSEIVAGKVAGYVRDALGLGER